METDKIRQVNRYLSHQMSPKERQSFELEVKADPNLALELKRSTIVEKSIKVLGQKKLNNFLEEIKTDVGDLPEPSISIIDRIRIFFYTRKNRLTTALLILSLLTLLFISNSIQTTTNYFIPPAIIHVVAGETLPNYSKATELSAHYLQNEEKELELAVNTLGASNEVAIYYLAHLYLKNKKYMLSKENFSKALSAEKALEKYNEFQDMHLLKFNHILSEFGATKDRAKTLSALRALKKEINNKNHQASSSIDDFINDLKIWYYIFK